MLKKILIGAVLAVVVLFAAAFFWARTVLTGESVRSALAAQVERAIGQPVTIGALDASIMPRVTLTLGAVTIGGAEKIQVGELKVGTDFNALLSRRIEHASLHLNGARIQLPLPDFAIAGSPSTPDAGASPAVELVSIDEIVLSDVQVVSGGRTLHGTIEIVPQGTNALTIRRVALTAEDTTLDITGQLTDLSGPVGELTVDAGALNLDRLLAFVGEFTSAAGLASATPSTPASAPSAPAPAGRRSPSAMNVVLTLKTEKATLGGLTLAALQGQARVTDADVTLNPVSFGIFGGQYKGSLALVPGRTLKFKGTSTLSNIDVAAATAFAGSPDLISGTLSGTLDFAGSGADPATVMRTATGKARVDITNGVVKHLGLVNTVVTATSMRTGALSQTASTAQSRPTDERFTRLGATLDIGGGNLRTSDLAFEATDLLLDAQGVIGLISSTVDMKGRVQLSDELTKQAGRDLVRYTQEQGRVTLPATVTGSLQAPTVRIDVGDLAKRAVQNAINEQRERATSEATAAVKKKLEGLFRR